MCISVVKVVKVGKVKINGKIFSVVSTHYSAEIISGKMGDQELLWNN